MQEFFPGCHILRLLETLISEQYGYDRRRSSPGFAGPAGEVTGDASFGFHLVASLLRRPTSRGRGCLADGLSQAPDRRRAFHGRSAFKTWLFAVIRSTARDTHRSIGRRLRLLSTWLASRAVAQEATAPALAYEHERRESVTRLLSGLSTRQRELLQLVFYHDLTVEQAADVLGISVGSARVHYERGKDNLRRRLAPFEEQHDRARRGTNQAAV